MPEHDWRPGDAAERAREKNRVQWYEHDHAKHTGPAIPFNKDAVFTSEEAVKRDRDVVRKFDAARNDWVPTDDKEPDFDLDLRSEEMRGQGL